MTRNRTVVGYDGSPESARALQWAVQQARATKSTVEIVQAWQRPPAYVLAYLLEARDQANQALAALAKETEQQSGVTVTTCSEEGPPGSVLLKAAEEADLVVVGSRGYGGFRGMLLGSVSDHMVHHAPCPVVVVRREGDGAS